MALAAIASVVLFGLLAFWLAVTRIEGGLAATGAVVLRGQPGGVQSPNGGIVQEILVADGDRVAAGDALIRFDPDIASITREHLRQRLASGLVRRARLEAELAGRGSFVAPPMPANLADIDLSPYLDEERGLFTARQTLRAGTRARAVATRQQAVRRIEDLSTRISALAQQGAASAEEPGSANGMLIRSFAQTDLPALGQDGDRAEHLARLRTERDAQRSLVATARLDEALAENSFRVALAHDLDQARDDVEQLTLDLARAESMLDRMVLRAPAAGVVQDLKVAGPGGTVAPNATVMTIAPVDDGLAVEVRVAPRAIASVHPGQKVELRFPGYDTQHTPPILGAVTRISRDSRISPVSNKPYYAVTVRLPPDMRAHAGNIVPLPGMQVQAVLQTPARSVLGYLVEPLRNIVMLAFRDE